jgi:excisionase family DNA binding protein
MGMSEVDKKRLKGTASPDALGVKPDDAARMLGESRTTIYRLLGEGKLRAVKRGVSTLIVVSSIHEYFDSLPPAEFGTGRPAA